jgi:hypothetical protein
MCHTSILGLLSYPQQQPPGSAVNELGAKLPGFALLQLPFVRHWLDLGPESVVLTQQGLPLGDLLPCSNHGGQGQELGYSHGQRKDRLRVSAVARHGFFVAARE